MKRILSILGAISLIGTSATSLIACNKVSRYTYTSEELAKIKTENNKTIKGNKLEWMIPQDKPFDIIDNKWFFVVWRGTSNSNWKIKLFQNISFGRSEVLDTQDEFELSLSRVGDKLFRIKKGSVRPATSWPKDDGTYFRFVYRWDGDGEPYKLVIDPKTGEVTDWKEVKEDKEVKKDK